MIKINNIKFVVKTIIILLLLLFINMSSAYSVDSVNYTLNGSKVKIYAIEGFKNISVRSESIVAEFDGDDTPYLRFELDDSLDRDKLYHYKITCRQDGKDVRFALYTNNEFLKVDENQGVPLAANESGTPITQYEYGSTSIDVPLMTGEGAYILKLYAPNMKKNIDMNKPISIYIQKKFGFGEPYVSPVSSLVVSGNLDIEVSTYAYQDRF